MAEADFEIRSWRNRLRAFLTGYVGEVHARRAPVLATPDEHGNGYTLDAGALQPLPCEQYLPRPVLVVGWIKHYRRSWDAIEAERLRGVLRSIAEMPEHDQDDAHRLRDRARRAIAPFRNAA